MTDAEIDNILDMIRQHLKRATASEITVDRPAVETAPSNGFRNYVPGNVTTITITIEHPGTQPGAE